VRWLVHYKNNKRCTVKVKVPRNRPEGPEGGERYSSTLS
jgi:hypothetical protein